MKRIVIAIDTLSGGGAERVMVELATSMQKQGHQVFIILQKKIIKFDVAKNIIIITSNRSIDSTRMYIPKIVLNRSVTSAYDEIFKQIEKSYGNIDIIISSLETNYILFKSIYHHKIFFVIHTTVSKALRQKFGKSYKFFLYKNLMKYVYYNKNIVTVSKGVGVDFLKNIGVSPNSIDVIYNGFDIKRIRALSNDCGRIQCPCSLYILHVGRYIELKRHDRLFRVFSKANLPCKLLLLGTGNPNEQDYINRLIKANKLEKKVIRLGFKKNPYPYMKNARLLILSSDYEGFSNVICESLICGTPVVSTNCPNGPKEILINECARGLAPLDNEKKFAEILENNFWDPYTIQEENIERFSIENMASHYLQLTDRTT